MPEPDKALRNTDRQLETAFQKLAGSIPKLAWMAGPDGRGVWYNQRWLDYTGTTLAEMQGQGWHAVHHPDHAGRAAGRFDTAFRAGAPWEDTVPLKARDGSYRMFLTRALPVRGPSGRVVRWFVTNTDVTDQTTAGAHARDGATLTPGPGTRKIRVLVVEDEPLTAMDLEARLQDAGYDVLGPAGSVAGAMDVIAETMPDIALLDGNLAGERSYGLAADLRASGVAVVFCTGYPELENLPETLLDCCLVSKPFRDEILLAALTWASVSITWLSGPAGRERADAS